jgi:hypothetical protein
MKLDKVRLGGTLAIVWGLIAFLTGIGNLIWNQYGVAFLKVMESIYPGYTFGRWGFWGVIVVTLYAALDGFVIGVVVAWIYNLFEGAKKE